MPTHLHMPVQPGGAQEINAVVAVVSEHGDVAYVASGVPMSIHREDDAVGRRVAAVQMMALGLARQDELSAALHVNRTTLYRQQRKVKTHGVLGVVEGKRGPRGPHRFRLAFLRASSSFCQSWTGTASGVVARASHRSSTSWSFSDGLRSKMEVMLGFT